MIRTIRAFALGISLVVLSVLAACSGASSDQADDSEVVAVNTVLAPLSEIPIQTLPTPDNGGGYVTWTPEYKVSTVQPSCTSRTEIGATGDVTVAVKADVTYVDLQFPDKLSQLKGIVLGGDYVALPPFLFEAHVSTVILGNQFSNRQHVYGCWMD